MREGPAAGGAVEPGQDVEQRGLAGPGGTDERHHLARVNDQVQALQRLDLDLAAALGGWVPPVAPTGLERQALQAISEAHAEARQICRDEMQSLDQTLNQMREGRERWRAYAAHGGQQLEDQP